jgi:APA family basic amino acid/polyamine antiporter
MGLILALQAVIYTYDGWSGPIYFSEEERNPTRDVPRALFLGCLSILAIYLLFNLALLYVVPIHRIAGDDFALGTAAAVILGEHGNLVARLLMVLSMLAGINAYHLMASRVLFGLSRDGLCPSAVARVNAGGTPSVALWLGSAVAALLILWSGTFQQLIAVMSFFFVANYVMSFGSLFVLRRREPRALRPFRAWGHPWTSGLALIASLAFLGGAVVSDTRSGVRAVALLAVSYPIYRLTARAAKQ